MEDCTIACTQTDCQWDLTKIEVNASRIKASMLFKDPASNTETLMTFSFLGAKMRIFLNGVLGSNRIGMFQKL